MISFALRGIAWSLGLFGLLRLGWFEALAVLPFTKAQARLAANLFGAPVAPIDVTLACSGADALALCAGVILAYPASWKLRMSGAAMGTALILALNTVRIGVLGRAAGSPAWFEVLHIYVWPALLVTAIASYVFAWMRFVNRQPAPLVLGVPAAAPTRVVQTPSAAQTRRFILLSAALFVAFLAASPLYLESSMVLTVAASIARAAALLLGVLGVTAVAAGNILSTSRGAFLVTQECIVTPLIPIYLAASLCYPNTWPKRMAGLLAALPLFFALGVARLLVVALPSAIVSSPLFLIHAFYQLLLAAVIVLIAALLRHGTSALAWRRALVGGAFGGLAAYLLGPGYAHALMTGTFGAVPLSDPQGALEMLPAFQVGLYVALATAAFTALPLRPFLSGLALLCVSQWALFAILGLAASYAGLAPHVRDVRAWSFAAPLLACGLLAAWQARTGKSEGRRSVAGQAIPAHWAHGPEPR